MLVIQMLRHRPLKNLGITLLEVMLSVIVITVLILAATRYYATTRENAKITQAVSMISNVVNASYAWVEGQNDFSSITSLQTLINANLLPSNYEDKNINPWKGTVKVEGKGGASSTSPTPSTITVTLSNVPQSACTILKQKITNVNGTSDNKCDTVVNDFSVTFNEN